MGPKKCLCRSGLLTTPSLLFVVCLLLSRDLRFVVVYWPPARVVSPTGLVIPFVIDAVNGVFRRKSGLRGFTFKHRRFMFCQLLYSDGVKERIYYSILMICRSMSPTNPVEIIQ